MKHHVYVVFTNRPVEHVHLRMRITSTGAELIEPRRSGMHHYRVKNLYLIVNVNDDAVGYLEWSHECNEYVFVPRGDESGNYLTGEELEYVQALKNDIERETL